MESGVEARTPWRVREPGDPTPEERAQHELTHLPFRSWCRFCVMGRGRQEGHFRRSKKESSDNMPEISLDYALPASEGGVGLGCAGQGWSDSPWHIELYRCSKNDVPCRLRFKDK